MKKYLPKHLVTNITAGFALFAMFFGSGNLIFPLAIGIDNNATVYSAAFGLMLTGVLVPLMGLFAVVKSKKRSLYDFFSPIGKYPALLILAATIALIGPIGVIPRCIMVAAGGLQLMLPKVAFSILSAVICFIVLILTIKRQFIIDIIGKLLTPILLLGIVAIFVYSAMAPEAVPISTELSVGSFVDGFVQGYQTMDLLAAFFFAMIIAEFLQEKFRVQDTGQIPQSSYSAVCVIFAILLGLVYLAFIVMGANYATDLAAVDPEKRLVSLAVNALGKLALPVSSVVIALACITTMCTLTLMVADNLREFVLPRRTPEAAALVLTLLVSFIISLVHFSTLSAWLAAFLALTYPAIIVYCILLLLKTKIEISDKAVAIAFWTILLANGAIILL